MEPIRVLVEVNVPDFIVRRFWVTTAEEILMK
jgi:hypothetical protein